MTVEALVLHFIDDLDSKINQFRNQRRQSPAGDPVSSAASAGYVYLPAEEEPPEDDEADEGPGDEPTPSLL